MKTDTCENDEKIDWSDQQQVKTELRWAMKQGGSRAVYDLTRTHGIDVKVGIDIVNEYMESPEMKLRRTLRKHYDHFWWLVYLHPPTLWSKLFHRKAG